MNIFSAIAFFPLNQGSGFKFFDESSCFNLTGGELYKCIEDRAFSINDIFNLSEANCKYFNISTSSKQVRANPFYLGVDHGLPHSLQIESGVITLSVRTSLHLAINTNITSTIMITDPKLQFAAFNPDAIPKTKLTLEQNKGLIAAYLKVGWF